tara:strand:+ start:116 stop:505 length:390 start_codon:yes stop_codon:yes gene_type:complete
MTDTNSISFKTNKVVENRRDHYLDVSVKADAILKSWKQSLFSHEWLTKEGMIKDMKELPDNEQEKRQRVEQSLKDGEEISKPVLGIGLLENVEIGTGKAEFLTLAAHGIKTIEVHIPKSDEDDFKDFIV